MSYVRPIRKDELVEWLHAHFPEFDDSLDVDPDLLATELIEAFDVITTSHKP